MEIICDRCGRDFKKMDKGTTIPSLVKKDLVKIKMSYPSLEIQIQIIKQLDELQSQTQSLESKYQQELDALDELKKSILQKAFNGEL